MRLCDEGQCFEIMEQLLTIKTREMQGSKGQKKVQGRECQWWSHLDAVAKMVQVARCNKTIATIVSWPSNDKDALM